MISYNYEELRSALLRYLPQEYYREKRIIELKTKPCNMSDTEINESNAEEPYEYLYVRKEEIEKRKENARLITVEKGVRTTHRLFHIMTENNEFEVIPDLLLAVFLNDYVLVNRHFKKWQMQETLELKKDMEALRKTAIDNIKKQGDYKLWNQDAMRYMMYFPHLLLKDETQAQAVLQDSDQFGKYIADCFGYIVANYELYVYRYTEEEILEILQEQAENPQNEDEEEYE